MNKKAILKELVKDPEIKNLLNMGFSQSIVNKLIIEELINEDEDKNQKVKKAAGMFQDWLDKNRTFTQQAEKLQKFMYDSQTIFKPTEKQTPDAPVRARYEEFTKLIGTLKSPLLKEAVSREEWKNISKQIDQNIKNGNLYDAIIPLATYAQGWTELLTKKIEDIRFGVSQEDNDSLTKAKGGNTFLNIFQGDLNIWNQIYKLTQAFVEAYKKNPVKDESEDSGEIPPEILQFLQDIAEFIIKSKLKQTNPDKIKDVPDEVIKKTLKQVGTLDDDKGTVSKKDFDLADETDDSIKKSLLDRAAKFKLEENVVLNEAPEFYKKFLETGKNDPDFKGHFPTDVQMGNFPSLQGENQEKVINYFKSDANVTAAIEKLKQLMNPEGELKIDPSLKPDEQEDEIVDETDSITKQTAVKAYTEGEGGKTFRNSLIKFFDEFMTTRYISDQTQIFNDFLDSIETFKKRLTDPNLQLRATNENLIKENTTQEYSKKEVSEIKKAELSFLKSMKLITDELNRLEKNGQSVLASAQKRFITKQAERMQDEIETLFNLVAGATVDTLKEEKTVFKTRKDKVEFVKRVFNLLEPRLQKFDELMTSFENAPGDEEVQLEDIFSSLDFFNDNLKKLKPLFDTKSTYFTKNKIKIEDLSNLLQQMKRSFVVVYKTLKPTTKDGKITEEVREKVLERLKKISTVIAKYIGPVSKIGTAPIPDIPEDAQTDDAGEPELPKAGENYRAIKKGNINTDFAVGDEIEIVNISQKDSGVYQIIAKKEGDSYVFNFNKVEDFLNDFEKIGDTKTDDEQTPDDDDQVPDEPDEFINNYAEVMIKIEELIKVRSETLLSGRDYLTKLIIIMKDLPESPDLQEVLNPSEEQTIETINSLFRDMVESYNNIKEKKEDYKETAKKFIKRAISIRSYFEELQNNIKESEEKLFSTFEGILKFPVIQNFLKPDFHRAFYKNFFKDQIDPKIKTYITTDSVVRLPKAEKTKDTDIQSALGKIIKTGNYQLTLQRLDSDKATTKKIEKFNSNLNKIKSNKLAFYNDFGEENTQAYYFLFSDLFRKVNMFSLAVKSKDPTKTAIAFDNIIEVSEKLSQNKSSWTDAFIKSIVKSNLKTYPKTESSQKVLKSPPGLQVGDMYKYTGRFTDYTNNLRVNRKYEIEQIDGSEVKFKNLTKSNRDNTEVGFIPWDQIKDKMKKVEEQEDVQEQIEKKN